MQHIAEVQTESLPRVSMKTLLVFSTAAFITLALFAGMHALTRQPDTTTTPPAPLVPVDPVFRNPDERTIPKRTIKPLPQPPTLPEQIREVPAGPENPDFGIPAVSIPKTPVEGPDIDFTGGEQDVRPLVRVAPRYPVDAARDGKEGWVKLNFDVDPSGAVSNIQVIKAEPAKVFNSAARRALAKWKYKPRMENGQAIAQTGLQVVLEFRLTDS